ncbi:MAG: C13 family peptidase [Thiotrichales bacterium]|nr:C13 family peptidase [Thiotrichales bacterium]
MFHLFHGIGRNLLAGLRLALFFRIRPWQFSVSFSQALALLFVSFLLPFAHDYLNTAPDHEFNPFGLSYQATLYLLFLLSVFVLLRLQDNFGQALKMVVMFLSVVPTIWLVCLGMDKLAAQQQVLTPAQAEWGVFGVYIFWYLLVISRAVKIIFHVSWTRILLLVSVYAIINIPALFYIPSQPLWYAVDVDAMNNHRSARRINVEQTYYLQDDLLALQAGTLGLHNPGKTDVYFLGFAGFADEDVFKNEVLFVKELMERKYTGTGNALTLINNPETVSRYPVANRHNLEAALRMLARKIDTDEDIVVMFFTSHGSEQHQLVIDFKPLGMNDLSPVQIHNAILGSGIKWKVIIISSCYSGGFVEVLQDPYTLLITAAAHDRNSFGCGHDGQFTYFGEAYFGHALQQTDSFSEAFNIAAGRVDQREREEGHTPSLPRMILGEEMEKKLRAYYRERQALN